MNDLTISGELSGLDKSKAEQIEGVFSPMVSMLKDFEGKYDEVMALPQTEDKSKEAKRLRLDISKVRISADKVRKEQKAEYLRAGNAIQGVYNILKFAIEEKENALKDVENYYALLEEARIKELHETRSAEVMKYGVEEVTVSLGDMDDAVWENFLAGTKLSYETKIEAEKKAEQEKAEAEKKEALYRERKDVLSVYARHGALDLLSADTSQDEFNSILDKMKDAENEAKEEDERIRLENEKLQKEAERLKKERDKKDKALEKERAEREEKERKEKERLNKERLEKERAEKEEKEAEKKAAAAPDKEKLEGWAAALIVKMDSLNSPKAKGAIRSACKLMLTAAEEL